jgi:phosphoserine phosphatase
MTPEPSVPRSSPADIPETAVLITVTGLDHPGIASGLFEALEPTGVSILDVEQVRIHGRLLLGAVVEPARTTPELLKSTLEPVERQWGVRIEVVPAAEPGLECDDAGDGVAADGKTSSSKEPIPAAGEPGLKGRHLVTVIAPELGPRQLSGIFRAINAAGGNIERIIQLARYPVISYELQVCSNDGVTLRRNLGEVSSELQIDVAVQPAGLHRRAKHLIVLDVDSTLVQGEVVDLLAEKAGVETEVAAITAAAMAGDLDFETALRQRVRLLKGLDVGFLDEVRNELALTPGARTLIRTLKRLGYVTALVSGGFSQVIEPIAADLGIDHVAANDLEVVDGHLTGELTGPIIDRAGKARSMIEFAKAASVPVRRCIAVGDGANDLDMLATAGLGIAFNAKPVVRDAADTSLNVPYLDTILYLLGVSRSEVDAADAEDDQSTS